MEGYEEYDDADRKQQKSLEKQCDNVFASIRAWGKQNVALFPYNVFHCTGLKDHCTGSTPLQFWT